MDNAKKIPKKSKFPAISKIFKNKKNIKKVCQLKEAKFHLNGCILGFHSPILSRKGCMTVLVQIQLNITKLIEVHTFAQIHQRKLTTEGRQSPQ